MHPRLFVLHERHQHAVGHGFFHTASVSLRDPRHSFEYVYDVGAQKTSELLTPRLDEYAQVLGTRPIDLVAISHFHSDHVSGLDRLFFRCKVDTVAIPFVDPIEKLVLVGAQIAAGTADASSLMFVCNREKWLVDRGVRRVLVVQEGAAADPPRVDAPVQGEQPPAAEPPSWRLTRGAPTSHGSDPAEPAQGVSKHPHEEPLVVGLGRKSIWELKFFCYRDVELWKQFTATLADVFKVAPSDLGSLVSTDWVLDQLRGKVGARGKLRDAYKKLVRPARLNWTSLCLWSAPALSEREYRWASHAYVHGDGKRKTGSDNESGDRVAWLGTGDAQLAHEEVGAAFAAHFRNESGKYGLASMSLPHHGSRDNHNRRLLNELDPGLVYATCPAPKDPSHQKHPAIEVEREIKKWRGQELLRVDNEDANGLHEWVRVHGHP